MARNRVIYQSQAVYASTAAYDKDLTVPDWVYLVGFRQGAKRKLFF